MCHSPPPRPGDRADARLDRRARHRDDHLSARRDRRRHGRVGALLANGKVQTTLPSAARVHGPLAAVPFVTLLGAAVVLAAATAPARLSRRQALVGSHQPSPGVARRSFLRASASARRQERLRVGQMQVSEAADGRRPPGVRDRVAPTEKPLRPRHRPRHRRGGSAIRCRALRDRAARSGRSHRIATAPFLEAGSPPHRAGGGGFARIPNLVTTRKRRLMVERAPRGRGEEPRDYWSGAVGLFAGGVGDHRMQALWAPVDLVARVAAGRGLHGMRWSACRGAIADAAALKSAVTPPASLATREAGPSDRRWKRPRPLGDAREGPRAPQTLRGSRVEETGETGRLGPDASPESNPRRQRWPSTSVT
jgi:hypothetical protein